MCRDCRLPVHVNKFDCKVCIIFLLQVAKYCKFENFGEGLIFAKLRMRSFVKRIPSRNGEITLSFTNIGKLCLSSIFFTVTNMFFSAIRENIILKKISEFTLVHLTLRSNLL